MKKQLTSESDSTMPPEDLSDDEHDSVLFPPSFVCDTTAINTYFTEPD